ncbi:MAG: potassium transporter KefB [Chloroflexales bacterium]|nr:potassium transporter KefB [Chloroflexales bacterium]
MEAVHLIPLAAGESPLGFMPELAALLALGAIFGYLAQRLGLVPIVGFLLAGVVLGPNSLGVVRDQELIEATAEIGVILLLFTIGLEFSLDQLARIRRLIFVGGGLQVLLVVGLTAGLLSLLAVPWPVAVFTGFLLSLSSTAVVMKVLASRDESDTQAGQITLGILIFQDLAVVAMVLLVPMLGGEGGSLLAIARALGTAALLIVAVLVVARRVMPPIIESVARTCSQEIFLLTVVAICFGTAYLTSMAGVSLSLGAFLAGLVVSDTRFRDYALGEILPLQVLFSATFFVSVGLLLDLGFLVMNLPLVLGVVASVVAIKLLTTAVSVRALGYHAGVAGFVGLLLAQIGEFSLVLERTGRELGLSPFNMGAAGTQTFIAVTVLLIVLTPFLAQAGELLQRKLAGPADPEIADDDPGDQAHAEAFSGLSDHVIIAGYGHGGAALARALHATGLPYGILTLSPGGANEAEARGLRVLRSDYTRQHVLEQAGLRRARMLVVADDTAAMTHRVISVARGLRPDLPILARARTGHEARELSEAGAARTVAEDETSIEAMLRHVLGDYGDGDGDMDVFIEEVRAMSGGAARNAVALAGKSAPQCEHAVGLAPVTPNTDGCEECLRIGDTWVHLRVCMVCGHVGCCDSSKNRHASAHFHESGHPVMRSLEPGEDWGWCYVDKVTL